MLYVIEINHSQIVLSCFIDRSVVGMNKPSYSVCRDQLVREAPQGLQAPLDNRAGQDHWEGLDQWERRASL